MDEAWRTHAIALDGRAERRIDQEWLTTNGTGAYAASTVPGVHTRRYHGLLVAATDPPVGRVVALSQVWDQLILRRPDAARGKRGSAAASRAPVVEQTIDLATLQFPMGEGTCLAPAGCQLLVKFERGLSVRWTYRFGEIAVERELFLHWKEQAVTLRYRVRGLGKLKAKAALRIAPMLTLRDFHALAGEAWGPPIFRAEGDVLRAWRGELAVTCHAPGAAFESRPDWWRSVFYAADHERGQEDREDYFVPGAFVIDLTKDGDATFTCALGHEAVKPRTSDAARAKHLTKVAAALDGEQSQMLAIAGDDFVVDRAVGGRKLSTVLAGYPWFADWGRDTFIALPGLLLCTGRFEVARKVLAAFAASLRRGLVPNRFDDYAADAGAAHYNTVDASLWFVHAAFEYLEQSGDTSSWKQFLHKAVTQIVDAYAAGTEADGGVPIYADEDGLISAGNIGSQLTWMDAACGGTVFTPRYGKAVEINALWYNALVRLAEISRNGRRYAALARLVRQNFESMFFNDISGGLYDHVTTEGFRDPSVRPNQIFSLSLPHSPLSEDKRPGVLRVVREKLLVQTGLRTLPPDDANYHPRYTGDQYRRDEGYHQGTVWPWLIGPYAEAVLRTGGFSPAARREAASVIAPLLARMAAMGEGPTCVGQLHEIYEAEPASMARPVGCFAQAWSVAEVLRIGRMIDR